MMYASLHLLHKKRIVILGHGWHLVWDNAAASSPTVVSVAVNNNVGPTPILFSLTLRYAPENDQGNMAITRPAPILVRCPPNRLPAPRRLQPLLV